jgi:hypothetical protein
MSCAGPMWQHEEEVWYWICRGGVCSKSTVAYFMALFGTLIKTCMNQEWVSQCLVIWSQTFSVCLDFVYVISFASFSIPFSLCLFLYTLSILPHFRLSPVLFYLLLLIFFCFNFVPSSFLTLLYVSNIAVTWVRWEAITYLTLPATLFEAQVSLSLWCSRTLTRFESLPDHHSAWEKYTISHCFIFTVLGFRHSYVQRRWQH